MHIDVHVHFDPTKQQQQFMADVMSALNEILRRETKIMVSLDETLTAVNAESTVDDSIIALVQGLAAQIAAGGLSAADQAKVDSIFAAATANAAKISAAVTANTPAAPPPAPAP